MILTMPRDAHARAVEWVLRRRGVEVRLLMGTDFPSRVGASLRVNNDRHSAILSGASERILVAPDAIWRRRPSAPMVRPDLHPADRLVAEKESAVFYDGLQHWLDSAAAFNANSREGAANAKMKSVQLRAAVEAGLRIPDTLISNDPEEVRQFFEERNGEVIIKSFSSPTWIAEKSAYVSFSKRLDPALLDKPECIGAAPAIYQELIRKKFEVRTFFAGAHHCSVTLDSQSADRSVDDWRARNTAHTPIGEHRLPEDVAQKSIEMMRKLGIVTGSLDFAVTEEGEYIFFEVNEQGQFLWMEDHCPSLPCLQIFCDFLLSGDPGFRWTGKANPEESFRTYVDSGYWEQSVRDEAQQHVIVDRYSPYYESADVTPVAA
jgi:hypothetical protein